MILVGSMPNTEWPGKTEKPVRGLRAEWPYFVYDHWYIDEEGNIVSEMVISKELFKEPDVKPDEN